MRSQFKLVGKSLKINKIHKYSLKEADKLKKNIFQSEPLDPSQWNYATTKIRKKNESIQKQELEPNITTRYEVIYQMTIESIWTIYYLQSNRWRYCKSRRA